MKRLLIEAAIAWQGVRRRPLRNVLTSISLLVGVASIVLIQGVGSVISQATVLDSVLENGAATTLRVPIADLPDRAEATARWKALLASSTGAQVVTVIGQPDLTIARDGQQVADLAIEAVEDEIRQIRPFPIVRGSWFAESTLAPQVVLNTAAWAAGGWHGTRIQVGYGANRQLIAARLVGVVYDGSRQPHAYLSMADSGLWRDLSYTTGAVSLLIHSTESGDGAMRTRIDTAARLSARSDELGEISRLDQLDGYLDQLDATRRMFLGIACLSLIVGSLGILNVGLATLRERSDELSLRRALGATRGTVLRIMIFESQAIAIGAAVLAVVLANVGTPFLLSLAGPQYVTVAGGVPLSATAAGLLASSGAALVGAIAPAIRASRAPIASIMRT